MCKIIVNTGYGYIKDGKGRIISKCELPRGEHPIAEGYIYVEVNSIEELSTIPMFQETVEKTEDQIIEEEIQQTLREMAIQRLRDKKAQPPA